MIEQPPLLTVRRTFPRPTPAQIEALTGAQTGHVADAFGGRAALSHRIKPIDPDNAAFCGVALTCHAGPGDIMATIAAYEIAEPGDVFIVATDACMTVAAAGDILIGMAKNRGAAAFVTDGCVRDIAGIRAFGLPCFAAGVTPDSPNCAGPGAVGFPVNMGGREIASGDVVIGDADGVVVIPYARIDEAIAGIANVRAAEAGVIARVEAGLDRPDFLAHHIKGDRTRWID